MNRLQLRRGLLLLASSTLALPSAAARTWEKQAPVPAPSSMMSVAAISPLEFWATAGGILGQAGKLLHTTDAGQSWEIVSVGNLGVNALFFLDSQRGWAAGGGFFHTTDGGQTWIQDNNWGSISDLFFLDAQRGWAGGNGGVAYRTTDGGLTWSAVTTPAGSTIRSIWFIDPLNGFAVGINGRIIRSTDGGQTWTLAHQATGAIPYLSTIQFLTPQLGWAIGGSTFLKTTDGGFTWVPSSVPPGTWSHGARFFDAQTGISVGESGNIVRTTNGGQTWTTVHPAGAAKDLYWDIEFASSTVAVLCGTGGSMWLSSDAGASWFPIQTGDIGDVTDLDSLDDQVAWAVNDEGTVLRTITGGTFWEPTPVTGFGADGELTGVDFADANRGWIVGRQPVLGQPTEGRIARSTDGGLTWTHQASFPYLQFFGVTAIDGNTAFAYGLGNNSASLLYRTTDGGQNWSAVGPPSTGGFRDAHFFPGGQVGLLLGGDDIFRTVDGGQSWTRPYNGSILLNSISFGDVLNGWATGYLKTLLRTTDGGLTWTPQNTGGGASTTAYLSVSATGPQSAWICGWNGYVGETTDGGQTWSTVPLPETNLPSYEVARFVDHDNGWVAGNEGIWRRSGTLACPSASSFGAGCPGTGGLVPGLDLDGCTLPGETVALSIQDGFPGGTAIVVFGAGEGSTPLGFGCALLAVPPFPLSLALPLVGGTGPAAGSIFLPAFIPPSATTGSVTLQAFSLDPGAPLGAAASNGIRIDLP